MRIGHYSPGLFHPGGVAAYLHRIVAAQRARGHEVILFDREEHALPAPHPEKFVAVRDDDELLSKARTRCLDVLHAHDFVTVDPKTANLAPGGPALVRTMHNHNAYCPSGTRYLAWPGGRPCPRRYDLLGCAWGHLANHCGSVRPASFLEDFRRVRRERDSARHFMTVAISQFVADQMARSGYDSAQIRIIFHPAPVPVTGGELPDPKKGEASRLLFLGRLVPTKGVDWLLRAAAGLEVPYHLDIAGVGPQERALRQLAESLGIAARVSFLGWVDGERTRALLAAARAVVMPSVWHEPAGLVTLEAAAAGRALVATRVGGIPEYAEPLGHALLVPPNDTLALTNALHRVATNFPFARSLGEIGKARLLGSSYGLDAHMDALEELYALAGKP